MIPHGFQNNEEIEDDELSLNDNFSPFQAVRFSSAFGGSFTRIYACFRLGMTKYTTTNVMIVSFFDMVSRSAAIPGM